MRTSRKVSILIVIIIGCASILGSVDTCTMGCNNFQSQESMACVTAKWSCDTTCILFLIPEQCYEGCSQTQESCIEESEQRNDSCLEACQKQIDNSLIVQIHMNGERDEFNLYLQIGYGSETFKFIDTVVIIVVRKLSHILYPAYIH